MATESIVPSPEKSFLSFVDVNSAAGGTLNLVALVAAKRVRVYRVVLNCVAAQVATFKDTAAVVLFPALSFGINGGLILDFDGLPWLETGLGVGLDLVFADAVQVSGRVWYTQRGDE
jgi:hypothetical protein